MENTYLMSYEAMVNMLEAALTTQRKTNGSAVSVPFTT
jgi:hypothetical protein